MTTFKGRLIDGASLACKPDIPAHAGYSTETFRYSHVLKTLEGQELTFFDHIVRGVGDSYYVLLPEDTLDHHNKPVKSKVVAVRTALIDFGLEPTDDIPVPYESSELTAQSWWEQDGYHAVRVLTGWVDGFCAFIPHETPVTKT